MDARDVDELHRIWELKEKGAISEDEYARLKAKILGTLQETGASGQEAPTSGSPIANALPPERTAPSYPKIAGIGCLVVLGLILIVSLIGSNTAPDANSSANGNLVSVNSDAPGTN